LPADDAETEYFSIPFPKSDQLLQIAAVLVGYGATAVTANACEIDSR
jgi:hypothetical protein